jgi:hypothetical protein
MLYELTLRVFGLHEFNESVLTELDVVANTVNLRALRLLRFGVQSPIIYQLIALWPRIQFLTIGAEIDALPPTQMPVIRLHELLLFRSLIPSEFLDWLLSNSESSLQILGLHDVPGQQIKSVLAKHIGPRIRSLRMLRFNRDSAYIMRLCTHLEELVLHHIPIVVELKDLPRTIEHLSIRSAVLHAPIIPLIGTLPNLRVVTFDENMHRHAHFPALQSACDANGVALWKHVLSFRIVSPPFNPCTLNLTMINYSTKIQ